VTKQRGRTTTEAKERDNRRDTEKEACGSGKQQTGRIDERTRRNDNGSQRQKEWTKERERTTS